MRKTLVGYVRATCAEGSVTTNRAYNATLAFNADGDYTMTLGKGGADVMNMVAEVEIETGAGGALAFAPSVASASDTSKVIRTRNAESGALVEPSGFAVSIYRMSPAITG